MKQLMRYEYYRIKNNKLVYVIFVVCCFITLFFCSSDYLSDPMIPGTPNNILGIYMNEIADVGIVVLIIAGCSSIYLFGEEFSTRTLNLELLAGYNRRTIYISHCIKTFLLTGGIISVSLFIGCLKFITKYAKGFRIEDIAYLVRSVFLIYILAFSMMSFCMIFAVLLQDTAKSTVFTFIFLFVSCYIMAALVSGSSHLYLAYEGKKSFLLRLYPPYLWRWSLKQNLSMTDMIGTFIIAGGWSSIFIWIGYSIFKKKELK